MRAAASAIAILCLRAWAQDAVAGAQDPAACAIGGTVADDSDGKPIARARVVVYSGGSYEFLRLTDEQGSFCFEKLTPGEYQLTAQKTGYPQFLYAVKLAVEENSPIKPLAIRMTRYASLSGTVLGAGGEPVPGATVTVWQRVKSGPDEVEDAAADSHGVFHFLEPPGTYYLSVKQPQGQLHPFSVPFADEHGQTPREKEVETFYSASFSFAGATPVELQAGGQLDQLTLILRRASLRRVTGRVPNTQGGALNYSGETETSSDPGGLIPIARDGTFAKADLPPAKYTFEYWDSGKLTARKEVDLTSGDALNVALDPIETADIPVTVRTEGKGTSFRLRPGQNDFLLVGEGSDRAIPLEAVDGGYRYAGVPRGIYRLWRVPRDMTLYVKSITYGGETQSLDKLDLRSEKAGGLEFVLSNNVAELRGQVKLADDENEDLRVILVDGLGRIASRTGTDQKGRFRMSAVPPGKYRLLAIEGFDEDDWSAEVGKALEGKSVEVELKEGEKKDATVPAVSEAEWAGAVTAAGR